MVMLAGLIAAAAAAADGGSGAGSASALEELAAGMAPGSWAELKTAGMDDGLFNWPPGHMLQWTDRGAWDPVTARFLFLGGAHAPDPGNKNFVTYSEAGNSWKRMPDPAWFCVGTGASCVMHAYEHATVDEAGREMYYRPFNSAVVHRYDLDADRWTGTLPPMPEYGCCGSLNYFPDRTSLLYVDGRGLQEFDFASGKWTFLADAKAVPMGDYHNMGIYNPVHKTVVFGGGNGSRALYRLDAAGKVTPMRPAPFPLSIGKANLSVDPWSGQLVLLGKLEFEDALDLFYLHDMAADRWDRVSGAQPIVTGSGPNTSVAAAPIARLGVVFMLRYDYGKPQVFLYKSTAQSAPNALFRRAEPARSPASVPVRDALGRLRLPAEAAGRPGAVPARGAALAVFGDPGKAARP
jgi:hypothetical protein